MEKETLEKLERLIDLKIESWFASRLKGERSDDLIEDDLHDARKALLGDDIED